MTTEKELEELLALAKSVPTTEAPPPEMNHVEAWIKAIGLQKGQDTVAPTLLWLEYNKWTESPVKKDVFFKIIKKLFRPYRRRTGGHNTVNYYKLDATPLDMSITDYEGLRMALKALHEERLARGRKT